MKKLSLLLSVILFQSTLAVECEPRRSPESSSLLAMVGLASMIAKHAQNHSLPPDHTGKSYTEYAEAGILDQKTITQRLHERVGEVSSKSIPPTSTFQVFTPDRALNHMNITDTKTQQTFSSFLCINSPTELVVNVTNKSDGACLNFTRIQGQDGNVSFQGLPHPLLDIKNRTEQWALWQTGFPPAPMTPLNPAVHREEVTQIVKLWVSTSDEHHGSPRLG